MKINIIGAGGLAREIISWNNLSLFPLEINECIDDDLDALKRYKTSSRVIGNLTAIDYINTKYIMAIMDSNFKESFYNNHLTNIIYKSYIHQSVLIGERTILGKGLVALPNTLISCDTTIGNLVFINGGSQIGHDVVIGNYTSIMANVDIGGGAVIGDKVFIGSGATILPGVKICDGVRIGAGSVVLRSIKKEGTYFGNPAKKFF